MSQWPRWNYTNSDSPVFYLIVCSLNILWLCLAIEPRKNGRFHYFIFRVCSYEESYCHNVLAIKNFQQFVSGQVWNCPRSLENHVILPLFDIWICLSAEGPMRWTWILMLSLWPDKACDLGIPFCEYATIYLSILWCTWIISRFYYINNGAVSILMDAFRTHTQVSLG